MEAKTKITHPTLLSQLAKLMQSHQISVTELARKTKVPQPTIYRLLHSPTNDPRYSTLRAIADYFEVPMEYFQSTTQPNKQPTTAVPVYTVDSAYDRKTHQPENTLIASCKNKDCFGIISTPSMQPKIALGSIVIIDPNQLPNDGSLVLVKYTKANRCVLQQYLEGGPKPILRSLALNQEWTYSSQNSFILGCAIQITTLL